MGHEYAEKNLRRIVEGVETVANRAKNMPKQSLFTNQRVEGGLDIV